MKRKRIEPDLPALLYIDRVANDSGKTVEDRLFALSSYASWAVEKMQKLARDNPSTAKRVFGESLTVPIEKSVFPEFEKESKEFLDTIGFGEGLPFNIKQDKRTSKLDQVIRSAIIQVWTYQRHIISPDWFGFESDPLKKTSGFLKSRIKFLPVLSKATIDDWVSPLGSYLLLSKDITEDDRLMFLKAIRKYAINDQNEDIRRTETQLFDNFGESWAELTDEELAERPVEMINWIEELTSELKTLKGPLKYKALFDGACRKLKERLPKIVSKVN